MMRWWYTDDKSKAKDKVQKDVKKRHDQNGSSFKEWKFKVFINSDLNLHEKVAISGNCDELGNWDPDSCVLMSQIDGSNIWTLSLSIPSNIEINYRYFVASIDPSNPSSVHVRRWETHLKPRCIPIDDYIPSDTAVETFGAIDGEEKIDKGWLTNETVLQFKFFNNPFMLKERIKNRLLYVKMTPMNLRINAESSNLHALMEESLSNDTRENGTDQPAYAFTEVATLTGDEYLFSHQNQFGRAYKNDDVLVFHITVTEPENMAYLIDLYTYSRKAAMDDDPPYHLGYHYLLPNVLRKSEGLLELPITCSSKHRPLGMMKVEYVKVTPLNDPKCDLSISYSRHWNQKHKGLDVGHRGAGTSFKASSGNTIRENTIASLKKAASSGAKFVEFDVQLSKDLHPVIYHDFHVYVSLKKKGTFDANDMLELPMRELTLEQLKNLKVYHTVEGRNREPKFFDEELIEHQPFPELKEALEMIDESVGFNIEIKSAQQLEDGTLEDSSSAIDKNLYVDCILEVVLAKGGNRRIVFSSFDPDICIMLRNKQNIYPTMFLTLGKTTRYKQYYNPLCNTIENAVKFSVANELLGIVAHSEDLLRDISQVNLAKEMGLVLFCWGDDNNCKETIKYLKDKGLHAIIYDKVDVLIESKDVYYVATESKRESDILEQIGIEHQFSPSTSLKLAAASQLLYVSKNKLCFFICINSPLKMNSLLSYTTILLIFIIHGNEAKLPRIIKPCSRNLQNLNGCIIDSINNLRPNLISGNLGEGFEIPKLDPLNIDEIKISNGNDLQANFKNLSVNGPSNFKLLNLETNVKQMSFNFDLELPNLEFIGDYSIALKILIKLSGNGKLQGIFKNCFTHVTATGKIIDEFNHVEFQLKVKMKVSYAQFKLENLFNNDSFLNKIGNRVINDNYEVFLNELVPGLEESLGTIFSRIVNNILKNSTYNEMFPEN